MRLHRALALALGLASACTGTETGNPSLRAQMGFAGRSSMPLQIGLPGDGAPVEVTSLEANVDSVDLVAAAECDTMTTGTVELAGVGAIDLLQPADNLREMLVAEDAYCAARVRLESLTIGGRRSDGTPFVWGTSEPIVIDLPSIDSLFIVDADLLGYITAFDVALALGRADLDAAVVDPDGTIHFDDSANAAISAVITDSVSPATALHRDRDRDGTIDADDLPIVQGDH